MKYFCFKDKLNVRFLYIFVGVNMSKIQSSSKKWIHPPDVILNYEVTYRVKFIGVAELSKPRKIVLVDEGSIPFLQELKRLDHLKLHLVDLSININGIKILDPNKKIDVHSIALRKVSYCVDDTNNNRLVAFVGKGEDHKHYCYGFESPHQAQEITLTIRQAFDQAYYQFMSPRCSYQSIQEAEFNEKVKCLQVENRNLKQRNLQLEQSNSITKLPPPKYYSTVRKDTEQNPESSNSNLTTTDNSKLDIFSDSILLHLPTTKKYLEKKQNSIKEMNSPARQRKNQAFLNQTIASVERAKVSMENLKEFVKRQNKQKSKKQLTSHQGACKIDSLTVNYPVTPQEIIPNHANFQPHSSENIINSVKLVDTNQEIGDNGLYQSIGDVIRTVTNLMDSKNNFVENRGTTLEYKKNIVSKDFLESNGLPGKYYATSNDYINLQSLDNLPDLRSAPPIPPKPEHLKFASFDTFSIATTSDSTFSDTTDVISQLSSLEMLPQRPYSHPGFLSSNNEPHSSKDFLDGNMINLNQPPIGYMPIKDISKKVEGPQFIEVDSLYDKVFDLMEKARQADNGSNDINQIRNLDTNKKSSYSDSKSLLDLLQQDNLFYSQKDSDKADSRNYVQNIQLVNREKRESQYSLQENKYSKNDFPTISSTMSSQMKEKLNHPFSPSSPFLKSSVITGSDASLSISKESLSEKTKLLSNPGSSKSSDKFDLLD